MIIAYSYIRMSSPEQIKGDSLRRQLELSSKFAQEHNLHLDDTLRLTDLGVSAYTRANIERGALGVFVEMVKDGRIQPGSYLLVESLDRISRSEIMVALELFTTIINAGIVIVTLSDNQIYSKEHIKQNWTQLIISISILARAHEESLMKSIRLSSVWAKKKQEARHGTIITKSIPSWLTIEDGKFVIDELKANTVRSIFELSLNGYGTKLIERMLNSSNTPVIARAKGWHSSFIIKLLHSPSVIGEYQPCIGRGKKRTPIGEPIPNYYPPILSEEMFRAVKYGLSSRRQFGGKKNNGLVNNLFSGLVVCGYCNGSMRYINKNSATNEQYLVCTTSKRGLGCVYAPWNYHDVEDNILKFIVDFHPTYKQDNVLYDSMKQQLIDYKLKKEKLLDAIGIAPDIPSLVERLRDTEKEIGILQSKIEKEDLERRHRSNGINETTDRMLLSSELRKLISRIVLKPKDNVLEIETKDGGKQILWTRKRG